MDYNCILSHPRKIHSDKEKQKDGYIAWWSDGWKIEDNLLDTCIYLTMHKAKQENSNKATPELRGGNWHGLRIMKESL